MLSSQLTERIELFYKEDPHKDPDTLQWIEGKKVTFKRRAQRLVTRVSGLPFNDEKNVLWNTMYLRFRVRYDKELIKATNVVYNDVTYQIMNIPLCSTYRYDDTVILECQKVPDKD